MALIFFGPRKLPQISRSLGKNLAEFRKASEDFKRTWEKEVNLEEYDLTKDLTSDGSSSSDYRAAGSQNTGDENSIAYNEGASRSLPPPIIEAVTPEQAIARHPAGASAFPASDNTNLADRSDAQSVTEEPKPSPKHDWL